METNADGIDNSVVTIKYEGSDKYPPFEMMTQNLDVASARIGDSINKKLHVQGLLFVDDKTNKETFVWSENAPDHEAMVLAYSKYKNITLDDARFQNELKVEQNNNIMGVYSHDRNLRSKLGVFLKKSSGDDSTVSLVLASPDLSMPIFLQW